MHYCTALIWQLHYFARLPVMSHFPQLDLLRQQALLECFQPWVHITVKANVLPQATRVDLGTSAVRNNSQGPCLFWEANQNAMLDQGCKLWEVHIPSELVFVRRKIICQLELHHKLPVHKQVHPVQLLFRSFKDL